MDFIKDCVAVDVGNTRIKAGVFRNNELLGSCEIQRESDLQRLFTAYNITHSVLSSVGENSAFLTGFLNSHSSLMLLSHQTLLPFQNGYATPETLGMDRVAGIAGAVHLFPEERCLIIDAGTCITYDYVDDRGYYHGGAISPGMRMRLRAMHEYTTKLPMAEPVAYPDLIGESTEACLLSGAFNGMAGEITQTISRYETEYHIGKTILCGGDADLFGKHIKKPIFAAPDLVLYGLNKILRFNVEKGL